MEQLWYDLGCKLTTSLHVEAVLRNSVMKTLYTFVYLLAFTFTEI